MFVLLNIVILFFQLFYYKRKFNRYLNYIAIFNCIWLVMIILSSFNILDTKVENFIIYFYIYLMLITFNLFSNFFLKIKRKKKDKKITYKSMNHFFTILIIFCFLILASKIPKILSLYKSGGFSLIRKSYLNSSDSNSFVGGIFVTWFINAVVISIFTLALVEMFNKKHNKNTILVFIISTICVLIYMLLTGGRFILFEILLLLVLEIIIHKNKDFKSKTKIKKYILPIFIILYIIYKISLERTLSGLNIAGNVYVYFFASINMLDKLFGDLRMHSLMHGKILFSGFLSPIYIIINKLFGKSIELPLAILNRTTSQFIWITPSVHMNNNCTFLYAALRDFGVIGIVIYSCFLAYILAKVYLNFKNNNNVFNEAIYIYIVMVSMLLLFEWQFARPNVVFTIILLLLYEKIYRVKIKK